MDLIKGQDLIKADGTTVAANVALEGKVLVLIYFSAHWCPPCRGFTPVLKAFYEVLQCILLNVSVTTSLFLIFF